MMSGRTALNAMRAHLYHALRRTLSQRARNRIKQRIAYTRKQLAPVYRALYGTFDARDLRNELARHVPDDAEIIMVHCSVNDLEPMYTGTLRELLEELIELAGPDRTLAMPAFFFGDAESDAAGHYRASPLFDARRQGSQMGVLSESFRRRKDVRRSLHPTHSVSALGPLAGLLTQGHHLAQTTFGEGTPFAVMASRRTAIIGIGTEYFRALTQVHAVEDLLGDRYPLPIRSQAIPVQIRDFDGKLHPYRLRVGDGPIERQTSLLGQLLDREELSQWTFHGVPLFATTAGRVTEVLTAAALRGETIYQPMPIRAAP
jgi:aminoglycoside 3-N-acetyltransferase